MDGPSDRVPVRKMYKLYINGAFVRSESARSDPAGTDRVARASRKDARDAVVAARAAQSRWAAQAPALRGLVLYRLAEMLEGRSAELAAALVRGGTADEAQARREVAAAVDRTLWYAGWADKYLALASSRNPVAGPYVTVTAAEPSGVVAVLAPDAPALLGLVTALVPPLVAGNTVVAVASERDPRTSAVFAEALATSDLPAGVANLLTGAREELGPVLAAHADIDGLCAFGAGDAERDLGERAAENVTRTRFEDAPAAEIWFGERYDDLDRVLAFTELKTVWHTARI